MVATKAPLLIRIPTDPGEGHDPRFTAYGEHARPIFVEWEPAVVACAESRAPLTGAFDLAVVVDGDGTIIDQFVMNTHLEEPELERDDADFVECVITRVRSHRRKFPRTPEAVLLVVRYPYVLAARP